MDEDFSMLRGERRSFFCHNKLWQELKNQTKDCISVSAFIKKAILEKLSRDEPEKEEYFRELI
jgi:hypothetical protein